MAYINGKEILFSPIINITLVQPEPEPEPEPETPTMTFTIVSSGNPNIPDGTQYEYEDGMTWREWVNSSYNTDGYDMPPAPLGQITIEGCYALYGVEGYLDPYGDNLIVEGHRCDLVEIM